MCSPPIVGRLQSETCCHYDFMASLGIYTVWLVVHNLDQHVYVWNLIPELENLKL